MLIFFTRQAAGSPLIIATTLAQEKVKAITPILMTGAGANGRSAAISVGIPVAAARPNAAPTDGTAVTTGALANNIDVSDAELAGVE